MQLTRQQIIAYLQTNRMATSIEMSRALQVTAANIRHHLKILQEAGLVEVVSLQAGRGRGRPMQLYSLTENALKDNLGGLASALLRTFLANPSSDHEQLKRIALHLVGDFQPAANIHSHLTQIIEQLNQLQYQASWEASPSGPRVIFRNCPYARILDEHSELCRMDIALISVLLNRPVFQTAKLERYPEGAPHCAFVSQQSANKSGVVKA